MSMPLASDVRVESAFVKVDRGVGKWKETEKKDVLWTDINRHRKKIERWTDGKKQGRKI